MNILRKGREFVKKVIALMAALLVTVIIAVSLCACGNKDDNTTTSSTSMAQSTTNTAVPNAEDGKVTDQSESGNNGAAGDLATDISEGLTDLSEKLK